MRTSIALIGFGFALARFGLFLQQLQAAVTPQAVPTTSFFSSYNLGVSLVIVGIVVIALAAGALQPSFLANRARRLSTESIDGLEHSYSSYDFGNS